MLKPSLATSAKKEPVGGMGFFPGPEGNPWSVWGPASYTLVLRARGQSSPDSFQDESAATIFLCGPLPLGMRLLGSLLLGQEGPP